MRHFYALTLKRAAFLSEHALRAPQSTANSDELDEELVDKVKEEQDKVAGEAVLQHDAMPHVQDPHTLPYSIVMP